MALLSLKAVQERMLTGAKEFVYLAGLLREGKNHPN